MTVVSKEIRYVGPDGRLTYEGMALLQEILAAASAGGGGGGPAAWGSITGTLGSQVDLAAALAGKANTSHTHTALQVTDFVEAVDDRVAALLVAGSNVTLTYNDGAGSLTIDAAGGGGGAGGSATIGFGAAPGASTASVAVTGQSGLLSGSRIRAWVQGSTADFNEYEHSRVLPMVVALGVSDVVAGTGFTIQAATEERLTGDVAVKWEWA